LSILQGLPPCSDKNDQLIYMYVCMYVCMYVRMYMFLYACVYAHTLLWILQHSVNFEALGLVATYSCSQLIFEPKSLDSLHQLDNCYKVEL